MGRREELAKAWIAIAVRSYQYRRIPTDTECTLPLAEVIEFDGIKLGEPDDTRYEVMVR